MKETMTTQRNMTEVETRRLEKYVERLREQPQWRNQLLIKNGQATFVKNGKVHTREFDTLKSKKVPQSLEIGLFFCQIFIFII